MAICLQSDDDSVQTLGLPDASSNANSPGITSKGAGKPSEEAAAIPEKLLETGGVSLFVREDCHSNEADDHTIPKKGVEPIHTRSQSAELLTSDIQKALETSDPSNDLACKSLSDSEAFTEGTCSVMKQEAVDELGESKTQTEKKNDNTNKEVKQETSIDFLPQEIVFTAETGDMVHQDLKQDSGHKFPICEEEPFEDIEENKQRNALDKLKEKLNIVAEEDYVNVKQESEGGILEKSELATSGTDDMIKEGRKQDTQQVSAKETTIPIEEADAKPNCGVKQESGHEENPGVIVEESGDGVVDQETVQHENGKTDSMAQEVGKELQEKLKLPFDEEIRVNNKTKCGIPLEAEKEEYYAFREAKRRTTNMAVMPKTKVKQMGRKLSEDVSNAAHRKQVNGSKQELAKVSSEASDICTDKRDITVVTDLQQEPRNEQKEQSDAADKDTDITANDGRKEELVAVLKNTPVSEKIVGKASDGGKQTPQFKAPKDRKIYDKTTDERKNKPRNKLNGKLKPKALKSNDKNRTRTNKSTEQKSNKSDGQQRVKGVKAANKNILDILYKHKSYYKNGFVWFQPGIWPFLADLSNFRHAVHLFLHFLSIFIEQENRKLDKAATIASPFLAQLRRKAPSQTELDTDELKHSVIVTLIDVAKEVSAGRKQYTVGTTRYLENMVIKLGVLESECQGRPMKIIINDSHLWALTRFIRSDPDSFFKYESETQMHAEFRNALGTLCPSCQKLNIVKTIPLSFPNAVIIGCDTPGHSFEPFGFYFSTAVEFLFFTANLAATDLDPINLAAIDLDALLA